ncbi:MAG: AAA family ATPase, partial [Candidatus Komeilibacteria bacterium CG10_big_fil_rev_8_21_14_0_10_41_13]
MKIELNSQFKKALDLIEDTSQNLFITGRAGTGKSTLLKVFKEKTQKNPVVLAPTGVAAVNVEGQTIHSFFGFKPDITPAKVSKLKVYDPDLYRSLKIIIIDEISMVRADLLDCVDRFLRKYGPIKKLPFGGVQMVFIGDLYQLAPVVTSQEREFFNGSYYFTPYFFGAKVFQDPAFEMELVELEKVYRQKDDQFLRLLNAARNKSITEIDLGWLNQRYFPDFEPAQDDFFIYLTSTNKQSDEINQRELDKLSTELYSFQAKITGDFDKNSIPTAEILNLKSGAQVMMLNNDSSGRWINGTVGKILTVKKDENEDYYLLIRLEDGQKVRVTPHRWDIYRYFLKGKEIQSETVGSFTQFPIRLAFAITIHKSQGKTFEKVIIDLGRGAFAHGQSYVALSRCVSFEGLILKKPLKMSDLRLDWEVVKFLTSY